jgi:PAT family beta-lactamase induction signal transducer AmpG
VVLAAGCLAWLPYGWWHEVFGAAQPMAGTLFTLVFVASALYLLAGAAVVGAGAPRLSKVAVWVAPLLLLMHARYWVDALAARLPDPAAVKAGAPVVFAVIALVGGVTLLMYARQPWGQLGDRGDAVAQPA